MIATTSKKSEKKPIKLPKQISDLDPINEKNFLNFYQKNHILIDQIIFAQAKKLGIQDEDIKDVRQEVIIKMHRCNRLDKFQPEKSSFNTYLTNFISGYVRHWATKEKRYQSNLLKFSSENPEPVSVNETDNYTAKETLELLRKSLNKEEQIIVSMLISGMTQMEIARKMSVSPPTICYRTARIKEKFYTIQNLNKY